MCRICLNEKNDQIIVEFDSAICNCITFEKLEKIKHHQQLKSLLV